MSKIILIFLAFIVLLILSFSYVLGAVRRMFFGGVKPRRQERTPPPADVLYSKDDIVVLKGEAQPKNPHK